MLRWCLKSNIPISFSSTVQTDFLSSFSYNPTVEDLKLFPSRFSVTDPLCCCSDTLKPLFFACPLMNDFLLRWNECQKRTQVRKAGACCRPPPSNLDRALVKQRGCRRLLTKELKAQRQPHSHFQPRPFPLCLRVSFKRCCLSLRPS